MSIDLLVKNPDLAKVSNNCWHWPRMAPLPSVEDIDSENFSVKMEVPLYLHSTLLHM